MKLLVLGGTVFLSRAVAAEAVRRGHDVVCAARGVSGTVPDGAHQVVWDRSTGDVPDDLTGAAFDAVVDVARHPGRVRRAVSTWPDAHWTFVSTINVYADDTTPGGTPGTLPLHEPVHTDEDPSTAPEVYGAMKVSCEQAVLDGASAALVLRPGLIVGPGDPTGRFSYWPARLAEADEVLAPGSPDDPVQVIDVRDLADWIVTAAEGRTTGVFDATGRVTSRARLLAEVADGLGTAPDLTWVPQEFLAERDVEPWSGPRSLPLWLPLPDFAGLMAHDVEASYAAGLRTRPIEETARDTLAWLRSVDDPVITGMTREEEAEVLSAWHSLRS